MVSQVNTSQSGLPFSSRPMNVTTSWNDVATEQLVHVAGGLRMLPHKQLEKELAKLIKGNAGNVSDYVSEWGDAGRIPYVGPVK
ncbi:MAG TPA: hypothetical protein PKC18_10790 [Lacipirellulaceae bacterium]|nr:hypothetical protein [Lacipirellulaceae bacterium]HMP06445.1 hypothetical protein [Lacipirellulaceae bacterium]